MIGNNRFSVAPTQLDSRRSLLPRDSKHTLTMDAGLLYPIYVDEILPGDTVTMSADMIARMTTPIVPVMDDAYLDYFFFFCPTRILWKHTKEFYGENDQTAWVNPTSYEIPQISLPTFTNPKAENVDGFGSGSLADYLGIPPRACSPIISGTTYTRTVNHLPFRAYVKIWNEYFRDQNLQNPALNFDTDATVAGLRKTSAYQDPLLTSIYGATLLPVDKFHDYFTSCTPQPQKSDPILIPGSEGNITISNPFTKYPGRANAEITTSSSGSLYTISTPSGNEERILDIHGIANIQGALGSINDLRLAFQTQKYFERNLNGTRFNEYIHNHFGVETGDARIQRPEYLGGGRTRVGIQQVVQTSSTDTTSPQGNTAAYSLTASRGETFTKSFVEPGYLLGLACVRPQHTYSQGLEKFWLKRDLFDFYDPLFCNIGNMPVYGSELYVQPYGSTDLKDSVFGFNEAWADYRYKQNRVSGLMRPDVSPGSQSLAFWNFADNYDGQPTLGTGWIQETANNMKRALAVQDQPMFLVDCKFYCKHARCMSTYSVPGLVDHM